MKICLCYPALTPGQKSKYGLQPLGVLYIGALLRREGFEVEVLDADIDGLTEPEMADRILESEPDIVGFSLMTPQLPSTLQTCFELKQRRPKLPIVLGGAHIASTGDDVFSMEGAADCFDFAVNGEGELTTARGAASGCATAPCRTASRGSRASSTATAGGDVIRNCGRPFFKELDDLAPIDYGMVDVYKYKIPTLPGPPVVGLMIIAGLSVQVHLLRRPHHDRQEDPLPLARPGGLADIVRTPPRSSACAASPSATARSRPRRSGSCEFCEKLIDERRQDRLALQHARRLRDRRAPCPDEARRLPHHQLRRGVGAP